MSTAALQASHASSEVMIKEIPIPLVRANQIMLIIGNVLALLTGSYWIVTALFIITISSLIFGPRANLAFRIVRPILGSRLFYAPSESVELQRFNQLIATTCMALATIILWTTGFWIGWIFCIFVIIAATAAVMGHCIGCLIYFPYKQKVRMLRQKYPTFNPFFDFVAGQGRFKPPLQERPQPLMLMGLAHEAMRTYTSEIEHQAKHLTSASLPALKAAIEEMLHSVEQHAQQEDIAMYPPFEAKLKGITKVFTDEHTDIHEIENTAVLKALQEGAENPALLPKTAEAVMAWLEFNRHHFRHEEDILMPHIPKIFSHEEAVEVVQSILTINSQDNPKHFAYVFRKLRPGQRYTYVNILKECCAPHEFEVYEEVLKPMVPPEAWTDFVNPARMTA